MSDGVPFAQWRGQQVLEPVRSLGDLRGPDGDSSVRPAERQVQKGTPRSRRQQCVVLGGSPEFKTCSAAARRPRALPHQ